MPIKKKRISPRQKMINLMYVVLMAMLALNVSSDVLNGFSLVSDGLSQSTQSASKVNEGIYKTFEQQMKANPEKVRVWYQKALQVKGMSDSLYNLAQELKIAIVKKSDGKEGDVDNIKNREDLEASTQVMLAPGKGRGKELYKAINHYRDQVITMVSDKQQRQLISNSLSTKVPAKATTLGKNWQEYMFENMPVAAAVTLLSKLQSDVRYAEGEVLHTLVSNIDMKDIRVNKLDAFVIPEKTTLYPGERFNANIVMAAVDTTQQPEIYVNGVRVKTAHGQYSFTAGGVGEHQFGGYILMQNARGDVMRRNFLQKYTVIPAPNTATVAADMMNVLYAGFHNPVSISVPGVPANAVSATMTGGSFISKGNGRFVAVPSAVGKDVTIHVTARDKGQTRTMPPFVFHVRKLPDPTAYLALGTNRFRGGALSKASLMGASGIHAAIDDGLLDIPFRVLSFETVFFDNMGNAVPLASAGANFSERQREEFRRLSRNRRFYISHIKAVGPDGITRNLPAAMEVIVR